MTKLPPPKMWVLDALNEMEVAEMLEEYIDFVDENGKSVRAPEALVKHYRQRFDGALPTIVAIATLPIVLADGVILAMEDAEDYKRGIAFRVPKEIMAILPQREDCTKEAVAEALRFLIEEWLVDVQTDFAGKCVAVAIVLTIIERSLLDQRPVFSVDAGKRGAGKTTLIKMLIAAATGLAAVAAAWTFNEEERRNANFCLLPTRRAIHLVGQYPARGGNLLPAY